MSRLTTLAFTLIELMMVIVILGILTAIGIPAYNKYVVSSKLSEAYQGLSVLSTYQTAFFNEFKEFLEIDGQNPTVLDAPMKITTSVSWTADRLPFPENSNTYFSYALTAGKTDNSGTELTTSPTTGNGFHTDASPGAYGRRSYSTGERCNTNASPSTYGVSIQPNYDWVIFAAVGDLNADKSTACTSVIRILQAINGELSSTGFVVLNLGE